MNRFQPASAEVLDPHKRMLERVARREENAAREQALVQARLDRRKRTSVTERVERAADRLKGANVSQAIGLIEGQSSVERDFFLLAEEFLGPARTSVLRAFPKPRKQAREVYLQGSSPTAPREAKVDTVTETPVQVKTKPEPKQRAEKPQTEEI